MIDRDLGRYRVLSRLGAGGMGEAYRAQDTRLEREVAIKVLPAALHHDAAARRRLKREALSLSKLNHPAIATIHDFDAADGVDFLVMEVIEGESLAARISRGPVAPGDAVEYARQIAEALDAAHHANVVHRDLKPTNVLITRANRIKVIDFGLAHVVEDVDATGETRSIAESIAGAGALVGTMPYMAPEQLQGGFVDARSDIYALGAVLYEMLTGMRPFREANAVRLIDAILNREAMPPRALRADVPASLDRLVMRFLNKDPRSRPQSAAEAASELAAAIGRSAQSAIVPMDASAPSVPARATSLVALPARVYGKDSDEFLAEAIPNLLTIELAKASGLDVKSPPTRHDVERVGGDVSRVASAYMVSRCVTTTVTASARKLTIGVQIVEARTLRILWAGEVEGTRSKYSSLVREAARGIRQALDVPLDDRSHSGTSIGELGLQRATYYSNLFVNRGHAGDLERAAAGFNAVLETNPRSAPALEGLAILELSRVVVGASPADIAAGVERYARRALEIDPRAARAWSALSEVQPQSSQEGFRLRLEYALRGVSLGSGDDFTHTRLTSAIFPASAFLAREAAHRAAQLDPLVLTGHLYEAIACTVAGDATRGLRCIETALALEPDAPFTRYMKTLILISAGRDEEALREVEALKPLAAGRLHPEWLRFAGEMARAHTAIAADGRDAEQLCAYLIAAAQGKLAFPRWQSSTSGVAILLTRYGRPDAALDLLFGRREAGLREPLDLLVLQPDMTSLAGDSRYRSLVSDAVAQFRAMLDVATAARSRNEMPAYLDRALTDLMTRPAIAAAIGAGT
ncbi:MAG TPA: protein kinase [Vicinamibacterales bacterium]|nr:protein kinase [Vicinamibacterales bacterium]